MIVNFIYNTIIDIVIIVCIIAWALVGLTIAVPIFWNLLGGSYFDIKDFIESIRSLKISK